MLIFLIIFLFLLGLAIFILVDLISSGFNAFFDKWARRTVWAWLPFYALKRLVREIFFDKPPE
jgi:hypothetical protein